MRRLLTVFVILIAISFVLMKMTAPASAVSAGVVISQVYGGGGNASAPYQNDFIELFNGESVAVSLNGWSVQYASTTGTTWQRTNLTNVTLQPGQYYLVQEAPGTSCSGAPCGVALPPTDASGTIPMALGAGKVALVNSVTTLTGSCPSAGVVDFVGFGSGTNCFEGTGPTATLTNTTAALRAGGGCNDTDSNGGDFSSGGPTPRNTASPIHSCGSPIPVGTANPASVVLGGSTLLTVTVTPGTNPTSTGLTVSVNLTAIGGSASQALHDDGGNSFSFQATVAAGTSLGLKSLPVTVSDAQSRSGSTTISLTVAAALTATGSANPSSLHVGDTTTLTVTVTPGTNPASTGVTVVGDLSAIGGSASQTFTANANNVFSLHAVVAGGTSFGGKSLAIAVSDTQLRSANASISLTVQPPTPPPTIKITQVYGGGGNSGATYFNDFIEIFNQGPTSADLAGYSVQYMSASANGTWQVTPICPSSSCLVPPGGYFLVQESQGASGTAFLPAADAAGTILMGAGAAKVALVAGVTPIVTSTALPCPSDPQIADLVGYGAANCFEGAPTQTLSNTSAAVRLGNGCVDTNNNNADFFSGDPIPRNSSAPVNGCIAAPAQPYGLGIATAGGVEPASSTLLTVHVTPAATPPSTGLVVSADLSSLGGAASQPFFDDGTHGDELAGDNIFSFAQKTPLGLTYGVRYLVGTITDAQHRTATAPITVSVISPACGVERWVVKVGTDSTVGAVRLDIPPTSAEIADLGAITAPPETDIDPGGVFEKTRDAPVETTVYVVDGTMTFYKKETDVDYHIVLSDNAAPTPHTLIAEIPNPGCLLAPNPSGPGRILVASPLGPGIANARTKFDARLFAQSFFQQVSIPVRVTGVGFFDFDHGQNGVAPNAIELHPVLDISFRANTTTALKSAGLLQYGQPVTFTATASNGSAIVPTGDVTFFDNGNSITVALGPTDDPTVSQASFSTTTLAPGLHSMTAAYAGDDTSVESTSDALKFDVAKADQLITFAALADKTFGDPPFAVTATGGASGNPVTFSASGDCTSSGPNLSTITLTTAGSCTVTASQTGNDNYEAAADVLRTFNIFDRRPPTITSVAPSVSSIWPPNKSMISVSIAVTATDDVDPAPVCTVTGITSNEPEAGDSSITGALTVSLLADRNGNGSGRVYTIGVRCVDASGNASTASATVPVPHDQGK